MDRSCTHTFIHNFSKKDIGPFDLKSAGVTNNIKANPDPSKP